MPRPPRGTGGIPAFGGHQRLRRPRTLAAWAGRSLLLALVAAAAAFAWASTSAVDPAPTSEAAVLHVASIAPQSGAAHDGGDALRVATWNIAYGRGAGTDADGPWPAATFERHLSEIAEHLRAERADIVLLQEVDRGAARSHGVDQARWLAERVGLTEVACVDTWRVNYVPFPTWPPSKHYGAMWSGQCVLSRFPVVRNLRHALPQPEARPWWYRRFYLHRAVQEVEIEAPGGAVVVFNVHLEAFDRGNREAHGAMLARIVAQRGGDALVVGGDLNAVPSDAPGRPRYPDEPEIDYRDEVVATVAAAGVVEVLGAGEDPARWTYPAAAPNRRLDYLFHGSGFTAGAAGVGGAWPGPPPSDHLPVAATLRRAR